jgi:hypothetical protein
LYGKREKIPQKNIIKKKKNYSDCVKLDVLYSKSREMLVIYSGLSFGAQYLGVLSSVVVEP